MGSKSCRYKSSMGLFSQGCRNAKEIGFVGEITRLGGHLQPCLPLHEPSAPANKAESKILAMAIISDLHSICRFHERIQLLPDGFHVDSND